MRTRNPTISITPIEVKDIKAVKGKFYIKRLIEEGEHEHQDFKFAINDARKIARTISAFANNDGGRLLIGVKDNGNIAGVRNEEDMYVVEQAAQMYCRPPQNVKFTAFNTDGGAIVLQAEVARASSRPVLAQEPDKSWRAYYRVNDENIVAPDIMTRTWKISESSNGRCFTLSETELSLIDHLKEVSSTTVEEYMYAAHISKHTAEDIISHLLSIDILTFIHTPSGFKITLRDK